MNEEGYFKNITYTDRENTPLSWLKFSRYVRLPLAMISALISFIYALRIKSAPVAILYLVEVVVLSIFVFAVGEWKKLAYKCIQIYLGLSIFAMVVSTILVDYTYLGAVIVYALEFYYYYKRRLLFGDEVKTTKVNAVNINNVEPIQRDVVIFNNGNENITKNVINDDNKPAVIEKEHPDTEVSRVVVEDKEEATLVKEQEVKEEISNGEDLRFCRYCGKKIPSVSSFCSYCGEKLN